MDVKEIISKAVRYSYLMVAGQHGVVLETDNSEKIAVWENGSVTTNKFMLEEEEIYHAPFSLYIEEAKATALASLRKKGA